jgi:carbon starvation protein
VTIAVVFLACLAVFVAAFRFYGGLLARRFGLDPHSRTPAHELEDGQDFVPTGRGYLLAQHFSAISAAGPIVGPIQAALYFGWLPALIWIVLGSVFIGAMHDFSALVGSVRHRARSVAEIVREHMSGPAFLLFLAFVWLALVYVIVAFTNITASAFVDELALAGDATVKGAGVATSSVLYLALGVAMGLALKKGGMPLWLATLVFVPLVGVAIWVGQQAPLHLPPLVGTGREAEVRTWCYVILAYCGVASIVPMWALLQPRGYLGGFFLYGVLAVSLAGILVGSARGGDPITYPAFLGFDSERLGALYPFLFITVACGACSGFHGLVCSGTTSKQLDRESDAHVVGYGGMLLEAVVALISLVCVMMLVRDSPDTRLDPNKIYALGVGRFVERFGIDDRLAVSFALLAFTTFVYDTLDVSTRLGRYVLQELTGRRSRTAAALTTAATVIVPAIFVSANLTDAQGRPIAAWRVFWPIFGSSNQLLAALTLLGITIWLRKTGRARTAWLTGLPMLFMMVTTLWSLALLLRNAYGRLAAGHGYDGPSLVALVLFVLAVLLVFEAVRALRTPPTTAGRVAAAG